MCMSKQMRTPTSLAVTDKVSNVPFVMKSIGHWVLRSCFTTFLLCPFVPIANWKVGDTDHHFD
jgi:hypothetical protein